MCSEIYIVHSILLPIGVNVQEWFLSPTVPNNKPYVHAYFRYLSKHCCVQNFFLLVYIYMGNLNGYHMIECSNISIHTCSAPTVLMGRHLYIALMNLGMNDLK